MSPIAFFLSFELMWCVVGYVVYRKGVRTIFKVPKFLFPYCYFAWRRKKRNGGFGKAESICNFVIKKKTVL